MTRREPELTPEERRAIAALKRLAKRWPKTLMLFAGADAGPLYVMRTNASGGACATVGGGMDPAAIVESIDGIPNDGGDW